MLPHVPWTDLVPDLPIEVCEPNSGVDGNMSGPDLSVLDRLVRQYDPHVLFEIGTFDGRTTLNLAAHAGPEARVFTLDLPPTAEEATALPLNANDRKYIDKPESGARFQGSDVAPKIVQLYGDSATFDFRPYWRAVDFVLVDGSHSYHYALNDSYAALEMIRGPGLIVWHDYVPGPGSCWPGLVRALEELREAEPAFGGLCYLAGTGFALLRVPARRPGWVRSVTSRFWGERRRLPRIRDSRRRRGLRGALEVRLRDPRVAEGESFALEATASNTGENIWLASGTRPGSVLLGCHLLDLAGRQLARDYGRCPFAADVVFPGESRGIQAPLPAPPRGRYVLEFDLVAERVCWFARNGCPTIRVPVEVV
jgi:hypothetical protein